MYSTHILPRFFSHLLLCSSRNDMCAVIDVVRPYQLLALSNHILLMCYHQHLHLPLCRESSQQLAQQPHLIHIKRSVDFVGQHDGAWLDGREKPSLRTPN